MLSQEEGRQLLILARQVLDAQFSDCDISRPKTANFKQPAATFVTLKKNHVLRGCIGALVPYEPLAKNIETNALNAAFHDHRFPPLKEDELGDITIEISILSQPSKLLYDTPADLIARLRPGTDGVILKCRGKSSTFLPQVWEQLPDPQRFLEQLCLKAGLRPDCWLNDDVSVELYQVQSFSEDTL